MNPIKATMDGNPVAIISRSMAFGAFHVAQGKSLELRKDGEPYVPIGRSAWEKTLDWDGTTEVSDRGGNFRLRPPEKLGRDAALFTVVDPGRMFPDEAIEESVAPKLNQSVVIDSKISPTPYQAKVVSIDQANFLIGVDVEFHEGESGAVVHDLQGRFVGFVSTPGGGITVPNLGGLAGTTPAPRPPQPIPEPAQPPTQADLEKAVSDARANERAKMRLELLAIADRFA